MANTKLIQQAQEFDIPVRYCLTFNDMQELRRLYPDAMSDAAYHAFKMGFIKGQRSERNAAKRKAGDVA